MTDWLHERTEFREALPQLRSNPAYHSTQSFVRSPVTNYSTVQGVGVAKKEKKTKGRMPTKKSDDSKSINDNNSSTRRRGKHLNLLNPILSSPE